MLTYFPDYYNDIYRLNIVEDKQYEYPKYVENYIKRVREQNEKNGYNGIHIEFGTRYISLILSLLSEECIVYDNELMDNIIVTIIDTITKTNDNIHDKIAAVLLLCCIVIKYPEHYMRNQVLFLELRNKEEKIIESTAVAITNIDIIAVKICMKFLFCAMGDNIQSELLEMIPYVRNDISTTITIARFISRFLYIDSSYELPKETNMVILQTVFDWLHMDYIDIKWNATRILLALLRNSELESIINRKIITLIEDENVYIKNLIIKNIVDLKGISCETSEYVFSVCQHDANFVTRKLAKQLMP